MKLYQCMNHQWVRLLDDEIRVPPESPALRKGDVLFFDHVDGMYSYCLTPTKQLVHPAAWTNVEPDPVRNRR
jgi:hypothetical protein